MRASGAEALVLAYVLDEGKDKMVAERAALALTWSGEAMYGISENEDLAYVIPKEGTNIWFDVMAVPKGSKNLEGAMQFMDFLNRPRLHCAIQNILGMQRRTWPPGPCFPRKFRMTGKPTLDEDLEHAEFFVHLGKRSETTTASGRKLKHTSDVS